MKDYKFIFYTDLFGMQRWEKLDAAGVTVAESATGFAALPDAMADASREGYTRGIACTACHFEWHAEPVAVPADTTQPPE